MFKFKLGAFKLTKSINISNCIQINLNYYSNNYFISLQHITNTSTGFYCNISGTFIGGMIHHRNFSVCCYWLTVHYSHYKCIVTHKPTLLVLNVRSRCLLLQFTAIKAVLFFS